ncbi:MAG: hypothetical protein E7406_02485 [Ruminococcaceae bacterium]|nr:hypothetical protein [Oscillospiraceae bacterium]
MKTLKKLGVLALVLVMALSFAACSKDEGSKVPAPAPTSSAVAQFVAENGPTIEQGIEQGADGVDCEVVARGNKIVISMSSTTFDNVPSDQRALLQEYYDSMKEDLKAMVIADVKDVEGLEAVVYEVCESNGTVIATVDIEI